MKRTFPLCLEQTISLVEKVELLGLESPFSVVSVCAEARAVDKECDDGSAFCHYLNASPVNANVSLCRLSD